MECARIYQVLYTALGDSAHSSTPATAENRVIDMYHGESLTSDQERIVLRFTEDSPLRCVLATSAFGLGVQIKDVGHVINWGPPTDLLDYWQQVGRGGWETLQGCHVPVPGMPSQEWSERGHDGLVWFNILSTPAHPPLSACGRDGGVEHAYSKEWVLCPLWDLW